MAAETLDTGEAASLAFLLVSDRPARELAALVLRDFALPGIHLVRDARCE
ncbi:MAG: hypothetical protein FWD12_05275 [Alphaproteobacteria bacterium]|nr:hypothetical protein [Alphaproteobacteria bacterium]